MKAQANLANNTREGGLEKSVGHDASILRPPKRRFLFYVVFTPPKKFVYKIATIFFYFPPLH